MGMGKGRVVGGQGMVKVKVKVRGVVEVVMGMEKEGMMLL
jgi:hypothetical protein